jgi:ribonuclease E
VRQLRLRDIGGIIVVDFIDMVLESNRDLVLRRLVECLSRDRTKHQVAEVTSLGLVQMTRKKLGLGLLESFSEPCEVCAGRGIIVHHDPIVKHRATQQVERGRGRSRGSGQQPSAPAAEPKTHTGTHAITEDVKHALAQIAASTIPHPEHKPLGSEAAPPEAAEPAAASPAPAPAEKVSEPQAGSGRRRGRHRRVTQQQGAAESSGVATTVVVAAPAPPAEPVTPDESAAGAPIVELPPVTPSERKRPARIQDADVLLDSVLDALPAPKKAGEGRSRSRRVSTAALSTAGAPPVITRANGSSANEESSAAKR